MHQEPCRAAVTRLADEEDRRVRLEVQCEHHGGGEGAAAQEDRRSIVERMIVLAVMIGLAWLVFPNVPFLVEASSYPRVPLAAGIGLGVGTVLGSIARALLGAAPSPASDSPDSGPSDWEAPH